MKAFSIPLALATLLISAPVLGQQPADKPIIPAPPNGPVLCQAASASRDPDGTGSAAFAFDPNKQSGPILTDGDPVVETSMLPW